MGNRVLSLIIILFSVPLLIIIGLTIYIIDGEPIFFKQKRVGLGNNIFTIFKFRTMKNNLSDIPTHLIKKNFNLYTKTGPILRRLSFDELPQLYNIFKGDMNFIGPRPALYNQSDLIKLRTKYNLQCIKPGLTGWAQVNGRDDLSIEEKVFKDKYYKENYSLFLDVKIIIKTIYKVLYGSGISKP